jgi:hypothetical protein
MFNTDVATGNSSLTDNCDYSTCGPQSSFQIKNALPAIPTSVCCYLWDVAETCSLTKEKILAQGTETAQDFILISYTAANGSKIFFNAAK